MKQRYKVFTIIFTVIVLVCLISCDMSPANPTPQLSSYKPLNLAAGGFDKPSAGDYNTVKVLSEEKKLSSTLMLFDPIFSTFEAVFEYVADHDDLIEETESGMTLFLGKKNLNDDATYKLTYLEMISEGNFDVEDASNQNFYIGLNGETTMEVVEDEYTLKMTNRIYAQVEGKGITIVGGDPNAGTITATLKGSFLSSLIPVLDEESEDDLAIYVVPTLITFEFGVNGLNIAEVQNMFSTVDGPSDADIEALLSKVTFSLKVYVMDNNGSSQLWLEIGKDDYEEIFDLLLKMFGISDSEDD